MRDVIQDGRPILINGLIKQITELRNEREIITSDSDIENIKCILKDKNKKFKAGKSEKYGRYRVKISQVNPVEYNSFPEFLKDMILLEDAKKTRAITYFQMKDNRRGNRNAIIPSDSAFYLCIDIDFKNKTEDEVYEWGDKIPYLLAFLKAFPNSYAVQKSKSGLGIHIYLLHYIGDKSKKPKDSKLAFDDKAGLRAYMNLLKEVVALFDGDTTVYDFARFIFASPNEVIYVPSDKLENITKCYKEIEKEFKKWLESDIKDIVSDSDEEKEIKSNRNTKAITEDDYIRERIKEIYLTDYIFSKNDKMREFVDRIDSIEDFEQGEGLIWASGTINSFVYNQLKKKFSENVGSFYCDSVESIDGLVKHLNTFTSYMFRQTYGEFRTARINVFKVLAKELVKRGIIQRESDFIKYKTGNKKYAVIRISPEENSPYDLFVYDDTDCFWLQSENAVRHLSDLAFLMEGVELVDMEIDEETGEVRNVYRMTGKTRKKKQIKRPAIPPSLFGYLFVRIARNWGIDLGDDVAEKLNKKFASYLGIVPVKFIAEQFIKMLIDAYSSKEKYVWLKDYIPYALRSGSRYSTFNLIRDYIKTHFGELVKFENDGNGIKVIVTAKFINELNIIRSYAGEPPKYKYDMSDNTIVGLFGFLFNFFYILNRDFYAVLDEIAQLLLNYPDLRAIINYAGGLVVFMTQAINRFTKVTDLVNNRYVLARYYAGLTKLRMVKKRLQEGYQPLAGCNIEFDYGELIGTV